MESELAGEPDELNFTLPIPHTLFTRCIFRFRAGSRSCKSRMSSPSNSFLASSAARSSSPPPRTPGLPSGMTGNPCVPCWLPVSASTPFSKGAITMFFFWTMGRQLFYLRPPDSLSLSSTDSARRLGKGRQPGERNPKRCTRTQVRPTESDMSGQIVARVRGENDELWDQIIEMTE